MYCTKCGNKVLENSKFCSTCGNSLNSPIYNNLKRDNDVDSKTFTKGNDLSVASLILGASSLMFSSFAPLTLIVAIIGLILGIVSKNKKVEKKVAIILNIVGIVLGLFITFIWILFFIGVSSDIDDAFDDKVPIREQNVFGVWDCEKEAYSAFGEKSSTVSLYLNKNLTFKWQNYSDELSDYYYGEYSYSMLSRRNDDEAYYLLQFDGKGYDKKDTLSDEIFNKKYTLVIDFEDQEASLKNLDSSERYICSYKMGTVSEL